VESSTANPVAPSYPDPDGPLSVTHPPPKTPAAPVRAAPAMTMDEPVEASNPASSLAAEEPQDGDGVGANRRFVRKPEPTRASRPDAIRLDEVAEPVPDTAEQPKPKLLKRRPNPVRDSPVTPNPVQQRRPSGLKRRPELVMPEAPPRSKSREVAPRPSSDSVSAYVDVARLRASQSARLKGLITVLALAATATMVFVFKDELAQLIHKPIFQQDGVPVRLSVKSNPPVIVTVVPPSSSGRRPLDLGRSPIDEQSGAFVGDTVRLENSDRGIYQEQVIEYGEPNQLIGIERTFKESAVRIKTNPPLRNATVYRGHFKLGQVGVNLSLFPGKHQLEIHADQLRDPVPFEVVFAEGAKNIEWPVDVSAGLEKK
jgi:hypothetical protein